MSLRSIHTLGRCSRPLTTASRSSSTVQEVSQNKPVIPSNSTVFSMIQPTGRIHLGIIWEQLKVGEHYRNQILILVIDSYMV